MKKEIYDKARRFTAVQPTGDFDGDGVFAGDDRTVIYNGRTMWTVDHYRDNASEASAWRAVWDKLLKYAPTMAASKTTPKLSPLQRAEAEIERLQALDRTLEASLKD